MPIKIIESPIARENWPELLDTITNEHTDIVITLDGEPLTVMIRYEEYVALQDDLRRLRSQKGEVHQTMLASERVFRRDWDTPEEDQAWAEL